jgi:hypothetical protein
MFGGMHRPLQDLHLAFPAGGAPAAGGIDMDPGLHGCLKEIDLGIDDRLPSARMKCDGMLSHSFLDERINDNVQSRPDYFEAGLNVFSSSCWILFILE